MVLHIYNASKLNIAFSLDNEDYIVSSNADIEISTDAADISLTVKTETPSTKKGLFFFRYYLNVVSEYTVSAMSEDVYLTVNCLEQKITGNAFYNCCFLISNSAKSVCSRRYIDSPKAMRKKFIKYWWVDRLFINPFLAKPAMLVILPFLSFVLGLAFAWWAGLLMFLVLYGFFVFFSLDDAFDTIDKINPQNSERPYFFNQCLEEEYVDSYCKLWETELKHIL